MKKTKEPSSFGRLVKYLFKRHPLMLTLSIIAILFTVISNVAQSFFIGVLTNEFLEPFSGKADVDWSVLYILLGIFGGIYALGVIGTCFYSVVMVSVTQKVLKSIRNEMFLNMEKLPLSFFDWNTHGSLMSYYTNDTESLRILISQSLPMIISSIFSFTITLAMMIYLSWGLTLAMMLVIIAMFIIIRTIGIKSTKYFVRKQEMLAKANGYIEELIEGQKVVKVFCHEEKALASFDELNKELAHVDANANVHATILMPMMNNIGFFSYAFISLLGGLFLTYNINVSFLAFSTGYLVTFVLMTRTIINSISQVTSQMNSITMGIAGAKRIFELLDQVPEVDEGHITLVKGHFNDSVFVEEETSGSNWFWKDEKAAGGVKYTPLKGDVRFEHVDFSYRPNKRILFDITLYAKPGQKVAFVGSTGAGKTTITNLINRFYDIESGNIIYDGINIKDIKKHDLRKSLGVVLQDTHLFTGTIKDNIRYGYKEATDEEVITAAKLANADVFIERLPDGYDTFITNDGEGLSQGERQLLSIARAAITNPPVLILDEATSSIDTRTERIIQVAMDNLMRGRTVFVIAHRLSTIRNSDAIMVMNHGRIIERGTHDDLLKLKGEYYQLYTGAIELD